MASCGLVYPATVEVGGAEVAERLSLGVPVAQFAENSQISLQTLDRLVVLGQLTVSAAEDAQRDALAIALADLPLDPKRPLRRSQRLREPAQVQVGLGHIGRDPRLALCVASILVQR